MLWENVNVIPGGIWVLNHCLKSTALGLRICWTRLKVSWVAKDDNCVHTWVYVSLLCCHFENCKIMRWMMVLLIGSVHDFNPHWPLHSHSHLCLTELLNLEAAIYLPEILTLTDSDSFSITRDTLHKLGGLWTWNFHCPGWSCRSSHEVFHQSALCILGTG